MMIPSLPRMQNEMLTPLYCFAAVFLSLGGFFIVAKWLFSTRNSEPRRSREIDPRLMEEWFEQPARRQAPANSPMFPQSDAEHFRAAHEALEQNLPVPLPPRRNGGREEW